MIKNTLEKGDNLKFGQSNLLQARAFSDFMLESLLDKIKKEL